MKLTNRFAEEMRLQQPDLSKDFYLFVDSSQFACGFTLCQRADGRKLKVISYGSELTEAQSRYENTNGELLVIVLGLE